MKSKFKLWDSYKLEDGTYWDFALFVKGPFHLIMWGRDEKTYFISFLGEFPFFLSWLKVPE